MIPLFSKSEFESAKSTDKLLCQCYYCKNSFLKVKKDIANALKDYHPAVIKFCSLKCTNLAQITKQTVNCTNRHIKSKVFQREIFKKIFRYYNYNNKFYINASMLELVDMQILEICAIRRTGSNPVRSTINYIGRRTRHSSIGAVITD